MQNSDNLPMAKTEVKNFGEVELFLCKSASFPTLLISHTTSCIKNATIAMNLKTVSIINCAIGYDPLSCGPPRKKKLHY